jgi:hypothetical protein
MSTANGHWIYGKIPWMPMGFPPESSFDIVVRYKMDKKSVILGFYESM